MALAFCLKIILMRMITLRRKISTARKIQISLLGRLALAVSTQRIKEINKEAEIEEEDKGSMIPVLIVTNIEKERLDFGGSKVDTINKN
jgi:hypothetical protein